MPTTYHGRFQRTTTGRPLRGKAWRYNREDLRALPVADFTIGTPTGAAPLDAGLDFSTLAQAGAARGVTTFVIDNDQDAPVTETDEATARAASFPDYAAGSYTPVVTATDELGYVDTESGSVVAS